MIQFREDGGDYIEMDDNASKQNNARLKDELWFEQGCRKGFVGKSKVRRKGQEQKIRGPDDGS